MAEPIQFPDGTFDFVILALGRSGSHMLASALDSHPDIQCAAEIYAPNQRYPWLGIKKKKIRGTTVTPLQIARVGAVSKAIVLTRNWRDRVKSTTMNENHALSPCTAKILDEDLSYLEQEQLEKDALLEQVAKRLECIRYSYEGMTENKDIRQIPENMGKEICEFLGVEYQPLIPAFYKPTYE